MTEIKDEEIEKILKLKEKDAEMARALTLLSIEISIRRLAFDDLINVLKDIKNMNSYIGSKL